jgi:hypothetical protein
MTLSPKGLRLTTHSTGARIVRLSSPRLAAYDVEIVGRERRERVSQVDSCGDA